MGRVAGERAKRASYNYEQTRKYMRATTNPLRTFFTRRSDSLGLTCEIYDDNYLKDTLLGSCEVDLKVLLKRPANEWRQEVSE